MASLDDLSDLLAADARLDETVRAMTPEQYAGPSVLPGWSRAHVLAHIALNAEALAGALEGVTAGAGTPMYTSDQQRDADIEALAATPLGVASRLAEGAARFAAAIAALPAEVRADPSASFERLPGGPDFAISSAPVRRFGEVEIHHADLGLSYAAGDWPEPFLLAVLDARPARLAEGPSFTARATDLGRDWAIGAIPTEDSPVVTGTAADLAWWLIGRGEGAGLSTSTGTLPEIAGY